MCGFLCMTWWWHSGSFDWNEKKNATEASCRVDVVATWLAKVIFFARSKLGFGVIKKCIGGDGRVLIKKNKKDGSTFFYDFFLNRGHIIFKKKTMINKITLKCLSVMTFVLDRRLIIIRVLSADAIALCVGWDVDISVFDWAIGTPFWSSNARLRISTTTNLHTSKFTN